MFQMILIALIVILLLVVLVPVGIALYQRLRPAPPPPAPRERAPIPPPQSGRAVPPIAPSSAPANDPPPLPTQMIQLPTPAAAPEPAGTEVLQWYGMLRCTGGALEGQHFIVEEGGFYIGRDATLSKVVINDSRISKRHVRIVPRNERVYAIDEGSTNGTFLGEAGGERITEVQLRRGDKLVLADNVATFVYQI